MITANRGGHNYQATGANGYVNEVTIDRLINAEVIKELKILGHKPNDVTPGNCDANSDLVYGVQMSNEVLNADIFNSNHLNAHVTCQEAKGCECVTYGDAPSVAIANRITDNLVKLGFKRRPNKVNKELYEVRATVAPSIIVEPFFVDSYTDVQLYYKVGAKTIGKAIAYGLVGKSFEISNNNNNEKVEYDMKNLVCYCNQVDKRAAEYLADHLKCPCMDATIPFNYAGVAENLIAVGGDNPNKDKPNQVGFSSKTTKYVKGDNRYGTIKAVLKEIGQL